MALFYNLQWEVSGFLCEMLVPKTFVNINKCLDMASSHSAYFSSCAVPRGAYASSELSLKSVAVMSLEQLCGALSNIINELL